MDVHNPTAAKMAELYKSGFSVEEIAERVYYSRSTVRGTLVKMRVVLRGRKVPEETRAEIARQYEAGDHTVDIARKHGVSNRTVLNIARERGLRLRPPGAAPLPKAKKQAVLEACRAGLSQNETAQKCGVSSSAACNIVRANGMRFHGKSGRKRNS